MDVVSNHLKILSRILLSLQRRTGIKTSRRALCKPRMAISRDYVLILNEIKGDVPTVDPLLGVFYMEQY